jgi:hypothetical protein
VEIEEKHNHDKANTSLDLPRMSRERGEHSFKIWAISRATKLPHEGKILQCISQI